MFWRLLAQRDPRSGRFLLALLASWDARGLCGQSRISWRGQNEQFVPERGEIPSYSRCFPSVETWDLLGK